MELTHCLPLKNVKQTMPFSEFPSVLVQRAYIYYICHCTHVRFFSEVAQEVLSAREKHYQLLYQLVDEDDHGLSLHDLQHGVPNRDLTVPHFSHLQ